MNVKKCPKCGEPLIFSFCLPKKEYICVPCGIGFEFLNGCERIEIEEQKYKKLKNKYAKDLEKIGFNTCKNGGGKCNICGTEFNCKHCKKVEKYELKYWGKATKRGSNAG